MLIKLNDVHTLLTTINEVFPTAQHGIHKLVVNSNNLELLILTDNKWFTFVFEEHDLIDGVNIDSIIQGFKDYISEWKAENGNN